MEKYINLINSYFQGKLKLDDVFCQSAYLRLNMLYLCPASLQNFRKKLENLGMCTCQMETSGITFKFNRTTKESESESPEIYEIKFKGDTVIHHTEDNKIYSFELDFDPLVSSKDAFSILYDIESFLKGCDAVFFMCNNIDIDDEILSNPLAQSIDYLYKRIEENGFE